MSHSAPRRVGPAFAHKPHTLTTKGLGADLLRDAARRLALAGLMYAVAFALSLAINLLFLRLGWAQREAYAVRTVLRAMSLGLGLGVFLYARRPGLSPARVIAIGLAFEIIGGLLIVWPESLVLVNGSVGATIGISWLAVWVTIFPMLLPARPRIAVAASLVTATMSPLSIWLLTLAGPTAPPVSTLTFAYVPNYVAAMLAMATSVVLHRMRGQIAEARALGSYELVERLGAGGMGEVWRASHRMLARPAAIKLIAPDAIAGARSDEAQELVKRFEREAQATASLSSPHTVALYDFGVTDDGTFYYVMELLNGIDLQRLVERFGPLPPERAVALLVQACASLDEAHSCGLVHRDVKPANVFTCAIGGRHDFAKVLDFGLVALDTAHEAIDVRLTQGDVIRGTPAFMAPEMASGARVDGRTDLYALGCVAYWLVTGAHPFESRSVYELVSKHMYETPEPPSGRATQPIPQEFDALVLRCLAKAPGDRPASARELAELLAAVPVQAQWSEPRATQWWKENLGAGVPRA